LGDTNTYGIYGIPSGYVYFMPVTSSGPGTIMSLSAYTGGYSGYLQVGLYSNNSGQPGAKLSASSPTFVTAGGWRTVDIPDYVMAGSTPYWLALETDNTQYTNVSEVIASSYRTLNTFGTFPSNPSSFEGWTYTWSLYANYCP
jgi:hypothetical protein